MDRQRLHAFMDGYTGMELTPEERAQGWHFCREWDGLLVGPDMPDEMEACTCTLATRDQELGK